MVKFSPVDKPRYNLSVVKNELLLLGMLMIFGAAAGCGGAPDQQDQLSPTPTAAITPYSTPTPAATHALATEVPTPTQPPLPSPTPFLYTVVEDDTMIAIAVRFGITLDQLQVANPEVSPNFLSIGTQLVIPINFDDQDGSAGSELIPLEEGIPECTLLRSGGMWCYWLVTNTLEEPVENISAVIRLYDQSGEQVAAESAFLPLNVIAAGERAPLAAYFPPPLPEWRLVQGQLFSAVAANQYQQRYLQGEIDQLKIDINTDGLSAEVSGSLLLEEGRQPGYIWVLAVAYDAEGSVVGVRRWDVPEAQLSDRSLFSFTVFSLDRPIDRVDVLFEARAISTEQP